MVLGANGCQGAGVVLVLEDAPPQPIGVHGDSPLILRVRFGRRRLGHGRLAHSVGCGQRRGQERYGAERFEAIVRYKVEEDALTSRLNPSALDTIAFAGDGIVSVALAARQFATALRIRLL